VRGITSGRGRKRRGHQTRLMCGDSICFACHLFTISSSNNVTYVNIKPMSPSPSSLLSTLACSFSSSLTTAETTTHRPAPALIGEQNTSSTKSCPLSTSAILQAPRPNRQFSLPTDPALTVLKKRRSRKTSPKNKINSRRTHLEEGRGGGLVHPETENTAVAQKDYTTATAITHIKRNPGRSETIMFQKIVLLIAQVLFLFYINKPCVSHNLWATTHGQTVAHRHTDTDTDIDIYGWREREREKEGDCWSPATHTFSLLHVSLEETHGYRFNGSNGNRKKAKRTELPMLQLLWAKPYILQQQFTLWGFLLPWYGQKQRATWELYGKSSS